MTLKELLRLFFKNFVWFAEDFRWSIARLAGWPQVSEDPSDPGSDLEPLDCENFVIVSIDEYQLVVAAGGDWQEPRVVTIKAIDNLLVCVHDEPVDFPAYPGLTLEEVHKFVNDETTDSK